MLTSTTPPHYAATVRFLLRFAVVMLFVGLLSGVAFQESSKKLDYANIEAGARLEAILSLALVHGHVLMIGVLIPIALASALFLAHRCGGAELTPRTLQWLTRVYVPSVAATVLLMLYKGYHVLLAVRFGERDFDEIDAKFFGGVLALRHGLYGLAHVGMSVALGVFAVQLWRSLKRV